MTQCRRFAFLVLLSAGASLFLSPATGCGDNRPKIRRPENPTPPPDPSMRLNFDSGSASPNQDLNKAAKEPAGKQ
jgi:hypothetical protein